MIVKTMRPGPFDVTDLARGHQAAALLRATGTAAILKNRSVSGELVVVEQERRVEQWNCVRQ
jgi:hypothetical protein